MLKILNIQKFIKENDCKEVTDPKSFDKDLVATPNGLYSPTIFGSNKQEQFEKFGFINLGTKIIHPLIFKNIGQIDGLFKKVLSKESNVKVENGILVIDPDGWTGIKDLYNNWDKIKFENYNEKKSKKKSFIKFLVETKKEEIFIDKMIVVPVNFRPAMVKNGLMVEDEISGYYKALLGFNDSERLQSEYMQSFMALTDKTSIIQKKVNELYAYFLDFLEKKDGLFRTSLIGKRVNNVARLVANAQPQIPIDCVVLPWHACLNIFDLPIIGMINKDPFTKDYLKELELEGLSPDDLANLFSFIYHNVDIYTKTNPTKAEIWQNLLLDTFNYHPELRCFLKRDPAWDKGSYHLLKPVINTENEFNCIINSLLYNPLGGDSFYTSYTVEENEEPIIKNEFGELTTPSKKCYNIRSINKIYEKLK